MALPEESGGAADQQCGRAGAARFRDQAQALVLHPIGTRTEIPGTDLLDGADLYPARPPDLWLPAGSHARLAGQADRAVIGARACAGTTGGLRLTPPCLCPMGG